MLIKELKFNNKGVFSYINDYKPIEIVSENEVKLLDNILISKFGNREISTYTENVIGGKPTDENMKLLGAMLSLEFSDGWIDFSNALDLIVENNDVDIIVTETIKDNTDRDNNSKTISTNDTVESMTGYNSDDFIDTDNKKHIMDSETDSGNKEKYERVRELRTKGHNKNNSEKIIESLTNLSIYDMMLLEVVRVIGTLMY